MALSTRTRAWLLYSIGGGLVITAPILFSPDVTRLDRMLTSPMFWRNELTALGLLGLFVLNLRVFLPTYYEQRRYGMYAACIVGAALVVLGLPPMLLLGFDTWTGFVPPPRDFHPNEHGWAWRLEGALTTQGSFFVMVWAVSGLWHQQQRRSSAEQKQLSAQLLALQTQINPHFLFNTLNGIYALSIEEGASKTSESLLQLAQMMRYGLERGENALRIPLQAEFDYLDSYIRLQATRLGHTVALEYTRSGEPFSYQIAPMLLLPFIENAFKHGVNPDTCAPIRIALRLRSSATAPMLELLVHNQKHHAHLPSTQLGLANTCQRLELLYPSRHQLRIEETETDYKVLLTMDLS